MCPEGEDVVGPFLDDRKQFVAKMVKPLQEKTKNIYVVPGSDAEAHVVRHFPHKTVKRVGNGFGPARLADMHVTADAARGRPFSGSRRTSSWHCSNERSASKARRTP